MSGFSNSEILKACSSPGKFATDQACDSVDEFKREIVGETSKVPDDGVSELKLPGGGINGSPDNITDVINDICTKVSNEDVNDQAKPSFLDDKRKYTNNLHQKVVVLALKSAGNNCNMKKSRAVQKASHQKKSGNKTLNGSTSRGQRSNIKEKSAAREHDSQLENASSGKKRGRKKNQRNSEINDEFSKMRKHLRYLLNKIGYEQNLLDAYSTEGWRGQSLEKLRPEKELERAKLDINRIKLKIRALFQRLDEVCAEGQFPEALFDEEGLVDSEDIFCAKCARKDVSPNNDIILCDGACDRGFHQLCLDPPLLTEEIPPGDEGWYCPACDCKFDCVELLNDTLGTKLSMSHSFERVFPEATAKVGSGEDDLAGFPSDDSEDDDFNPGGADDDNAESGDSSSDESDFSSASEDLAAIHNTDDQYLGLPSDDSEDEDFAPDFLDAQDQPEQQEEGSSSDFTSASEDLHAVIENGEISSEEKKPDSPSELVQDFEDIEPVTGRRQAEKLDYKKLYDEAYGNTLTDSSEDEDWQDAAKPKKRKNISENPSESINGEEYSVTPKRRRYGPRNDSPLSKDTQAATVGPSKVTRNDKNVSPLVKDIQAATDGPSEATRYTINLSPPAKDTQAATGGSSEVAGNSKNGSPLAKDTEPPTAGRRRVARNSKNVSPLAKDTEPATAGPRKVARNSKVVSPIAKDTEPATAGRGKVARNSKNVSPLAKDTQDATAEPREVSKNSKDVSPLPKDTQDAVSGARKGKRNSKTVTPIAKEETQDATAGTRKGTRNRKTVTPIAKEETQDATAGPRKVSKNSMNLSPLAKDTQDAAGAKKGKRNRKTVTPIAKEETQAATPEPSKGARSNKNVSPLAKEETPKPSKVAKSAKNVSPLADTLAATPEPSKFTRNTRNSSNALSSPEAGVSNDSRTIQKSPPYTRLGEDAIQILTASFEKNNYPDRSTKKKLAEELGLSTDKVSQWFGHARWAANHSATGDGSSSGVATRGKKKV